MLATLLRPTACFTVGSKIKTQIQVCVTTWRVGFPVHQWLGCEVQLGPGSSYLDWSSKSPGWPVTTDGRAHFQSLRY